MNVTPLFQALCLVLSLSVFSAAQGLARQGPAGRQLAAWLAGYDGTDWDAYLTFLKTHFAIQPGGRVSRSSPHLRSALAVAP